MEYLVKVTATVKYYCELSEEDSEKVDKLVRQSKEDPNNSSPYTLEEAVWELYDRGQISLYDDSLEHTPLPARIDNVEEL